MLDKAALRKNLLAQRMELGEDFIKFSSDTIIEKLIMLLEWESIKSFHSYLPISSNNEINTFALLKYVQENNFNIDLAVPYISNGKIASSKFNEILTLSNNRYGFPEPLQKEPLDINFDVIIVPILGFDRHKNRLGYGKGYYDKFLKDQPGQKIGLAYSGAEIKPNLPTEPHDVRLDYIITEKEVVS